MAVLFTSECLPDFNFSCRGGGACSGYEIPLTDCCSVRYYIDLNSSGLNPDVKCEFPQQPPEPPEILYTNLNWNDCSGTPVGSTIDFSAMIIDTSFYSDSLTVDDDLQITVDGESSIFEEGSHTSPSFPNALLTDCEYSGEVEPNCNRNHNIDKGTLLVTVPAGSTVSFGPVDNHGGSISLSGQIILRPAAAP